MIISCPNCNKKFNLDQKLIPEKGRLLLCSSCNHKWHYTIPNINNEIKLKEEIQNQDNENKILEPRLNEETFNNKENKKNNKKKIEEKNIKKKIDFKNRKKNNKFNFINLFKNLIIIIITFFALILILDTFKMNISKHAPALVPLLDNLYQSFVDLSSFLKDLVK
tara:strand:+ start:510 stop:1004 length:495 start_codon:yes stop_codon:yes gene_type:complete